jgi:hypothetical protein
MYACLGSDRRANAAPRRFGVMLRSTASRRLGAAANCAGRVRDAFDGGHARGSLSPHSEGHRRPRRLELAGLPREPESKKDARNSKLLIQLMPEDLLKFGLIPEFIGRLPIVVTLDALDELALRRILVEPRNALVRQFQKIMGMDGVELATVSVGRRRSALRMLRLCTPLRQICLSNAQTKNRSTSGASTDVRGRLLRSA